MSTTRYLDRDQMPASDAQAAEKAEEAEALSTTSAGENMPDQDHISTPDLEKAPTQASRASGEPAHRVRTAVDWEPNDPENPQLWPRWRKLLHMLQIGILAFAVTTGSSLITPSLSEIAAEFGVSQTASIATLSVYVLGLALGPMIAAPLSETFGRNVIYRFTPLPLILFLIGAGFSKSFGSLVVCRLLAGIAGAPVLAVGAGSSADMFPLHERAVATSIFVAMPFLGPAVGPVIGGFVAQYKGWRWTQWCTIFIAIAAYAAVLPLKETYKKIILGRRAKKYNIEGPPKPNLTRLAFLKFVLTVTLIRPLHMLFTEPMVLFFSLYNAFTFSVLFAFFAAYPYTFGKVYGFNDWQTGLTFLGILVGVLLASFTVFLIDRFVYFNIFYKRTLAAGKTVVAPEHRLYAAMAGSFGVPIGLFWFAWTARTDIHWIVPTLAGIPFAWGNLAIFISGALYLIHVYGPLGGASALAANGLMRYSLGAAFPLFTIQMYETLGIGWATSLLGFIAVAMMVIPWVFFSMGPKFRAQSSYDTLKVV